MARSRYSDVHRIGTNFRTVRRKKLLGVPGRPAPHNFVNRRLLDRRFYDVWEELEVKRSFMDFFLQPYSDQTPCWETATVKRHLEQVQGISEIQLDDQQYKEEQSHHYKSSFSIDELYDYLRQRSFQADDPPDARRLLISIRNLDAGAIHMLAKTALIHQRDCLKDAFWKHISFEASIRVGQSVGRHVTPHIEMHLPYLVLRTVPTTPEDSGNRDTQGTEWEDVTFLSHNNPIGRDLIYQTHVSIVVCIWNSSEWTGYRFSNPYPFNTDEISVGDNDVEADGDDEEGVCDIGEDIFAPDGAEDFMSDRPIWDPRRYFLQIVAVWIRLLLKEYTHVIRTLEERVKAKERIECTVSGSQQNKVRTSIEDSLSRTIKTMQLLRRVRLHTSTAIKAWNEFSTHDGDLGYLIHSLDDRTNVALSKIKDSFFNLAILEQKLVALDQTCEESAKILSLQLGNESMALSLESNRMNKQTHEVTLEASILNRRTTNLAYLAQKAAVKTQYISHVNIEVILFTTPFILALQYFGAERDIFSFDRNTKNFICCVLVLLIVLRLFVVALNAPAHVRILLSSIKWKRSGPLQGMPGTEEIELDDIGISRILEV